MHYQEIAHGYWGVTTATLDWCERNYTVSYYIAEFYNAITNFPFLLLAFWGLQQTRACRSELRFVTSYLFLALVGVGSFFFHASLLYEYQLLDELPMIYGSSVFVFSIAHMFGDKNSRKSEEILFALILIGYSVCVTFVYLYLQMPVFHQTAFGILIGISALLPLYNFYRFEKRLEAALSSSKVKLATAKEKLGQVKLAFYISFAAFIGGFSAWNIDNIYCHELRELRSVLTSNPYLFVLAPLFELHGLWHLGTAVGCYNSIVSGQILRAWIVGKSHVQIHWKWGLLPFAVDTSLDRKACVKSQ